MASGQNDPKLLYAIDGVQAYHISNGQEVPLNPAGPQTLSLLMVPVSSPFADISGLGTPAEDFYLHLHLPPELDLPLPATTQIYHQPPSSYLIPRWDLGPDSGAFTRIEFPRAGSRKGLQEDVDTFETILAQCTAFLERTPAPHKSSAVPAPTLQAASSATSSAKSAAKSSAKSEKLPAYNPAAFQPGEGYAQGSHSSNKGGKIVLVDEEDGSVIGELTDGYQLDDSSIKPGSKEPVEIALPADSTQAVTVQPASQEYMDMAMHPAYKKSSLVSSASRASRLIVTSSDIIAKGLQSGAEAFAHNTTPVAKPVTFNPATHEHIRRINRFSSKAADMSATTVGQISRVAQNVGASLAGKKTGAGSGYDEDGNPIESYKPGLLNRSLMAFNTVVDGIELAGKNLLGGTTSSITQMVEHRWGPEAGQASRNLGGGFKNVGLVYIDVTGVSRRAVLKSVAKGMVVGKVANGGGRIIVGGGDGGSVPQPLLEYRDSSSKSGTASIITAQGQGGVGNGQNRNRAGAGAAP
ncbi:hypothetical protein SODALDRAFT_335794 [Sodiomyces alkalinus F11]|uniref:Senescence domain-containing protein n=1 Tax=Sodiomyces alkalinus (strain CBS 110278 / VKM F-3762 / F11) TaxID=1314773 RepID=A0A3N2Q4T7_SODAK|nr:hypothetical protein SODALDRAFT_335794 [Sodiomyces alkalinus F11]ROT41793.1 hypothetical protein SODALDRAFT_335794 [Sodiomyces alkalinus F11]